MRAALYGRVSTVDKIQDPEMQLGELREYAARRGFDVVAEFVDFASGARNGRPEYQRMLDAARKRRFDVLLVWRYDRFARSMQELVNALEEFRTLGIDFVSYRENADTTTAQGKLILGIMASLAEFERALIAERVKAGMARAKAQGKHVGRPRIPPSKEAAIRRDLLAGRSLRSTLKAHESAPRPCSGLRPSWPIRPMLLEGETLRPARMSVIPGFPTSAVPGQHFSC